MFIALSYTTHTIISITLHMIGILVGLFVWYLFPKHPTRSIIQLPAERVSLIIEPSTVIGQPQDIIFSPFESKSFERNEKLIDVEDNYIPQLRQAG